MELILMRHAQSKHNLGLTKDLDSSITPLGESQAERTAIHLWNTQSTRDLSLFTFISSPMHRTLQTSKYIHNLFKTPFYIHEGARECLLNDYPGSENGVVLPYRDHEFLWEHYEKPEGAKEKHHPAETYSEFMYRIKAFLDSLDRNGKYFIVSHASPIQAMYAWMTRGESMDIMDQTVFDSICKNWSGINNCSVTHIKRGECLYFGQVYYDEVMAGI